MDSFGWLESVDGVEQSRVSIKRLMKMASAQTIMPTPAILILPLSARGAHGI